MFVNFFNNAQIIALLTNIQNMHKMSVLDFYVGAHQQTKENQKELFLIQSC